MIQVPYDEDELSIAIESEIKPLTADEAQALRQKLLPISPWMVVRWQIAVGLVLAGLVWLFCKRADWVWSVAYGAICVVLPNVFFARGLARGQRTGQPGAALSGFFVWELLKIALTVAMLFASPKLIAELNWLALLAGFVVTMKVSWVAVWFRLVRKKSV